MEDKELMVEPSTKHSMPPVGEFHVIQKAVNHNWMHATDGEAVFRVKLPKGQLFDAYLAAMPEEFRQQNNCSCCRSFLNRFGGLVKISTKAGEEGKLVSALWDVTKEGDGAIDSIWHPSLRAMAEIVESGTVSYEFISKHDVLGDFKKGGFSHFALDNMNVPKGWKETSHLMGEKEQEFTMLSAFMGKVSLEVLEKSLVFFQHDARLKTATEFVNLLEWAVEFKKQRDAITNQRLRKHFIWAAVGKLNKGKLRIGNGVMGKFIDNITDGDSFDVAKAKFLDMTKEEDFRKPKAAPAEGNVQTAEKIIKKLGLAESLPRRFAMLEELSGVLWTHPEPEAPAVDADAPVFGHLKTKNEPAKPKIAEMPTINAGTITLQRFMDEVLPDVTEMYVDLMMHVKYNFAGFTVPVDPNSKPMLMWDKEDQRNVVAPYMYLNGSHPHVWNLHNKNFANNRVKVTHIVADPSTLNNMAVTNPTNCWLLEGAVDVSIQHIPVNAAILDNQFHEIRATMQSYYKNTPLTPLAEGQKTVAGLWLPRDPGAAINIVVTVMKAGVSMTYNIDRAS